MDKIEYSNGAIHEIRWGWTRITPLQLYITEHSPYVLFGDAEFLRILLFYSSTNLP